MIYLGIARTIPTIINSLTHVPEKVFASIFIIGPMQIETVVDRSSGELWEYFASHSYSWNQETASMNRCM